MINTRQACITKIIYLHYDFFSLGNGKTHYINEKLKLADKEHQVTIAVNEAFSTVSAIEKLHSLPRNTKHCAIFFNFTILPPVVSSVAIVLVERRYDLTL